MLVTRHPAATLRDERGSALVVAMIVVLVLGIVGMSAAVVVTNTTASVAGSRDSSQSRAAADAGMAAAIAESRRTGATCGLAVSSEAAPEYRVNATCTGDRATFRSIGEGPGGRRTTVEAVYLTSAGDTGADGDMVFFGNTTFTSEVKAHTLDENLLSIVIPMGGFTCMSHVPANIIISGTYESKGGCTVDGSVVAGGTLNITNTPDTIHGNVTAAGAGTNRVDGAVGGDLHTRGALRFGAGNKIVGGSVIAGGDVKLATARIQGSLTLPPGAVLTMDSGSIASGVFRPDPVAPPEAPTFAPWFDYAFRLADWQPYEGRSYMHRVLTASGTGQWTCGNFNSHPAAGWTSLSSITSPTIVDARACSNLSTNSGTQPVVTLAHNVVFLAKSYDLTRLTMKGAANMHARAWFIVEDTTANSAPSCAGGGNISINGTVVSERITAMAYTPCTVNVQGMGFDSWRGSFYGGSFNYGGGLAFYGDGILLPRMPGGGPVTNDDGDPLLGALVSQRDVR